MPQQAEYRPRSRYAVDERLRLDARICRRNRAVTPHGLAGQPTRSPLGDHYAAPLEDPPGGHAEPEPSGIALSSHLQVTCACSPGRIGATRDAPVVRRDQCPLATGQAPGSTVHAILRPSGPRTGVRRRARHRRPCARALSAAPRSGSRAGRSRCRTGAGRPRHRNHGGYRLLGEHAARGGLRPHDLARVPATRPQYPPTAARTGPVR